LVPADRILVSLLLVFFGTSKATISFYKKKNIAKKPNNCPDEDLTNLSVEGPDIYPFQSVSMRYKKKYENH
jgi:hypothetical protein